MRMGHHLDAQGRFQSDKYPELKPDKIVVSFTDLNAQRALATLAVDYAKADPELSQDIFARLNALSRAAAQQGEGT